MRTERLIWEISLISAAGHELKLLTKSPSTTSPVAFNAIMSRPKNNAVDLSCKKIMTMYSLLSNCALLSLSTVAIHGEPPLRDTEEDSLTQSTPPIRDSLIRDSFRYPASIAIHVKQPAYKRTPLIRDFSVFPNSRRVSVD